jgi:hypothetical protein
MLEDLLEKCMLEITNTSGVESKGSLSIEDKTIEKLISLTKKPSKHKILSP